MLKPLFQIHNEQAGDTAEKVLSLRVGLHHCAYAITDKTGDELYSLGYYSHDGLETNPVELLFSEQPILNKPFMKVMAGYDYAQSTLVPIQHYRQEDAVPLLETLFGVNGGSAVITEPVSGWELYNVYAVPKVMHEWMNRKFTVGHYWHQYTIAAKNTGPAADSGQLLVDLRTDDFTVIATAGNKLLLAQVFLYSTPEDILYYLLKVCQEFGFSQQEVSLLLSGLIEKESALYKELYQYFIHIDFRQAGWKEAGGNYPSHFFTSLNDLARCAS